MSETAGWYIFFSQIIIIIITIWTSLKPLSLSLSSTRELMMCQKSECSRVVVDIAGGSGSQIEDRGLRGK